VSSSEVHSFSHEAMTTFFEVMIKGEDSEYARQAAEAVFREVDRLEGILSRFNACSDIGQINLLKPGESVRVSIEALECLEQAGWIYELSAGLFDPARGSGFDGLKIDRSSFCVGWDENGAGKLDLGGIGKGYALDRAKEILKEWEIGQALIHAGSSTVLACGGSWDIGVGGLWAEGTPEGVFALEDRALSGSGTEVKGEHIIDPFSGKAPSHHLAAWAVHPSAAISDALATAFMLLDDNKIKELCVLNPETVGFVVNQKEELKKIRSELDGEKCF